MLSRAAILAATCFMSTSAVAQTLATGTFTGQAQFTSVNDPNGICASWGVKPNSTTSGTAKVMGLSNPVTLTSTMVSNEVAPFNGVQPITCSLPAMPPKSAFVANGNGAYVANPQGERATPCNTPQGTLYEVAGNGTLNGVPQTLTITLPNTATSSFQINATNVALSASSDGSNPICYIGHSTLYSKSN